MKLEAWQQADIILDEMESLRSSDGPMVYLFRSIIRFRQSDLFLARSNFLHAFVHLKMEAKLTARILQLFKGRQDLALIALSIIDRIGDDYPIANNAD